MDDDLGRLLLEGGGGQLTESYELAGTSWRGTRGGQE